MVLGGDGEDWGCCGWAVGGLDFELRIGIGWDGVVF